MNTRFTGRVLMRPVFFRNEGLADTVFQGSAGLLYFFTPRNRFGLKKSLKYGIMTTIDITLKESVL